MIAATMIVADLVATAGFAAPSVYRNLDSFVTAISVRGTGFCEPQLMARVPCYANVAGRYGAGYESDNEMVCRKGWYLRESATAEEVERAASDSAHFESGLHVIAYHIDAHDTRITETRRTMFAGSFMRSSFALYTQMPNPIVPGIDQICRRALGTVGVGVEESDGSVHSVEGVGGADEKMQLRGTLQVASSCLKEAPFFYCVYV